jgi:hypothetical protein
MRQMLAAQIALGVAAVAALVALVHRHVVMSGTALGSGSGRMLGKGPYTSAPCKPSHELAQKLKATLDELREAARDGDWSIDWQPLDESLRNAKKSDEAGNFPDAVRQYCRGISYVMNELRSQNVKKASDSAVRY